jgi:hypothetical protein
MVEGSFYESGRCTESFVQESMQNKMVPALSATGSSAATILAGGASGSSQTAQLYYYVHRGNYYYWDTHKDI